jgi:hypothetical protein
MRNDVVTAIEKKLGPDPARFSLGLEGEQGYIERSLLAQGGSYAQFRTTNGANVILKPAIPTRTFYDPRFPYELDVMRKTDNDEEARQIMQRSIQLKPGSRDSFGLLYTFNAAGEISKGVIMPKALLAGRGDTIDIRVGLAFYPSQMTIGDFEAVGGYLSELKERIENTQE